MDPMGYRWMILSEILGTVLLGPCGYMWIFYWPPRRTMHELQLNLSRQIRSNSAACGGSMDKDFSPCCPTFAWTAVSTQCGVAWKRHSCLLANPHVPCGKLVSHTFRYLGSCCFVNFKRGSARLIRYSTWIKRGNAVALDPCIIMRCGSLRSCRCLRYKLMTQLFGASDFCWIQLAKPELVRWLI